MVKKIYIYRLIKDDAVCDVKERERKEEKALFGMIHKKEKENHEKGELECSEFFNP
jgi:hypothetical protein